MKISSIAKNIIAQYGVAPENIKQESLAAYAHRGQLVSELNTLKTQLDDLRLQRDVLKKYREVKGVSEELKTLSGRRAKQYRKDHSDELADYVESRAKVLELFPTGSVPTVENLEKRILLLEQEIAQKNGEYQAVNQKSKDLMQARQEIEAYLKNEREVNQKQKKKKRNDLE